MWFGSTAAVSFWGTNVKSANGEYETVSTVQTQSGFTRRDELLRIALLLALVNVAKLTEKSEIK